MGNIHQRKDPGKRHSNRFRSNDEFINDNQKNVTEGYTQNHAMERDATHMPAENAWHAEGVPMEPTEYQQEKVDYVLKTAHQRQFNGNYQIELPLS